MQSNESMAAPLKKNQQRSTQPLIIKHKMIAITHTNFYCMLGT